MRIITARTVSEALSHGLHHLRVFGMAQPSRVGDVLVSPYPVVTVYNDPTNRVLNSVMRDANPFFHVMESLWMLAGRNDLPWLTHYNKRFASYSDDGGKTQPGAYGYRWRNHFGYDQLETIITELKSNPQTRRCVLAMWDGGQRQELGDGQINADLLQALAGSNDVPCNTHAYFDTLDGRLNMTVLCRSNDIIWGAYGANAVHFSFLLEYIAAMTGLPIGVYRQVSNNFHLYTNVVPVEQLMPMSREVEATDPYLTPVMQGSAIRDAVMPPIRKVPLVSNTESFLRELEYFMSGENPQHDNLIFENRFFCDVAMPMRLAWEAHKIKDYNDAFLHAERIRSQDWQQAAIAWLQRRERKYNVNKARFTEALDAITEDGNGTA